MGNALVFLVLSLIGGAVYVTAVALVIGWLQEVARDD